MSKKIDFSSIAKHLQESKKRRRIAVARPADDHTVAVIERCLAEGIADFTLVADAECSKKADEMAQNYGSHVAVCTATSIEDAAQKAVAEVHDGRCDILMKGTLNTDVLLRAVLNKECGLLRKGAVMSHITVADIPTYDKLLIFSDAAVVPRPSLEQFEAIISYDVEVFRKLHGSTAEPRVALIHCTEKTNEKFPHTLSYAKLKLMSEAGTFGNAIIDGPMDVKTACDLESGRIKGIASPVVGNADILVFPNIEAANVFYKTVTFFSQALTAGMLSGTTAPIVVASRADSTESKYCSLLLACATVGDAME